MAAVFPSIFGATATTAGGAATILGAGTSIFAGAQAASADKFNAGQMEMKALSEETQAAERANAMREEFLKNLSAGQAAFGAQGTTVSGGDALNAAIESAKNDSKNVSRVTLQGKIDAGQSRLQASQYRRNASASGAIGFLKGTKTLLDV